MEFLIIGIIVIFAIYKIGGYFNNKHSLDLLLSLKQYEPFFNNALADFSVLTQSNWYVSDRQYRIWKEKYKHLAEMLDPVFYVVKTEDPLKKTVTTFGDYWNKGRELVINNLNEKFVMQESPNIRKMLTEKDIQNNDQQIVAIASDEDNTLLVAGAGTGKTTTILGKLAYLTERVGIKPEEILLLSFTGRAVDELTDRITKKFPGKNIKAQTFHSFGLSILGGVLGKKPDLAFASNSAKQKFLNEEFESLLKNDKYLTFVVDYFAYYLKPVVLEPGFNNLDDYYKYVKTERNITFRREQVKSQQEVMIANFLYMHGLKYEYESSYKHETATSVYKQYKPDFYLPDYDIYIEHFGINRAGRVHFSQNESQNTSLSTKYRTDMEWKRNLHKKYKTKLIETFSYEFTEHTWKENLKNRLQSVGVTFFQPDPKEVYSLLEKSGNIREITELFSTFLDLCKSNSYTLPKLRERIWSRRNAREMAFYEIFSPIYQSYEDRLSKTNSIDFHDMLIKAADFISRGLYHANYKYVIIDEFQDFSVSKYVLVKAICDQNPDTKLFCVGDDWQSIFRFAGSDISLMTNFEEAYGYTRKNQLVITNRFNNSIAIVSNKFILKNPNQIKKEVTSGKIVTDEAVSIFYKKGENTEKLFHEILGSLNTDAVQKGKISSVFLLGRYKFNKPEDLSKYLHQYKNLNVEFLTIHAAKGSEADYVIILDVTSGKYGFPSEITDDPLLEIVLSKGDPYPHAEERRLMYVAMTRARDKVFIITEDINKSAFVLEMEGEKNPNNTKRKCQDCGGQLVRRKGPYGVFWGCDNFPDCTYTLKGERVE
ncbi:MAG: UvrD-helicase domain-containing protein [Parcubacteria group bacterium]